MKRILPIGNDSFLTLRENDWYYIDKSLMIKDFIEYQDTAALITRPRRFGKTLNMTMLREFFDITKDSRPIFEGLEIMITEYADRINSKPVIFFSFKDCITNNATTLRSQLIRVVFGEYRRYYDIFGHKLNKDNLYYSDYYQTLETLKNKTITWEELEGAITYLLAAVYEYYKISPILLIDEYDQPILSSYENGYHEELNNFFSAFYGSALKGNEFLGQALLTGIQRVAKESIFSRLNNVIVYTVLDKRYAPYFGLNQHETEILLNEYDLALTDEVKRQYDGYLFHDIEMYNPWSVINYANKKTLDCFWVNTSTNSLIHKALKSASDSFLNRYHQLIENGSVEVGVKLETSFIEIKNEYTLWGLLVNSGYLTISQPSQNTIGSLLKWVRIPNEEVKSEFQTILAEQANISPNDLELMFHYLLRQDMVRFLEIYQNIVLSCTSYFDAERKESSSNEDTPAYHMLFLGMCISLRNLYKVTSNIETGYGRHDIRLEALSKGNMHLIIEFKQGEEVDELKEEALQQILNNRYYTGLDGEVLCLRIAHNKKHCAIAYKKITI